MKLRIHIALGIKDFFDTFLVSRWTVAPPGAQRFKPAEERMEAIDQATPGFLTLPFQYRAECRGFWSLASILSKQYEEVKS